MRHARLLWIFLLVCTPVGADERILSFHSDIQIYHDGAMQVIETIRVNAEGRQIRRGIYRDFPTDYRDRLGHRYRVKFDVVSVERDGYAEPWFIESRDNGVRIYIGRKETFLDAGEYTYTIHYRTDRQLGFFASHDELYWNVTGNGWAFDIDAASATVRLPGGIRAEEIRLAGYTGYYGYDGQDLEVEVTDGLAEFATTRVLGAKEGLTIVVGWPKGFITAPDFADEASYLLSDNRSLLISLLGLIFVLTYYFLIWQRIGKDPEAGIVIPRYTPPEGYSPAAMRFINRMGYDHKTFATGLVNLAVKGFIEISEDAGDFSVSKKAAPVKHVKKAPGERALMKHLFLLNDRLLLEQKNHSAIKKALDAHKASLKRDYERKYFITNSLWVIPGVIASVAMLIFAAVSDAEQGKVAEGIPLVIWLTMCTYGVFFMSRRAVNAWRAAHGFKNTLHALSSLFITVLLFVVEVILFISLSKTIGFGLAFIVIVTIGLNYGFYNWLKTPTRAGRKLLDRLHGFQLYLEVAEKDELNLRNPPQKTPALFEVYLPFAMALDVEQVWAEKFTGVFRRLMTQGKDYVPDWYHGDSWDGIHSTRFTSALGGSLSSTISSSSTAPGSSSGFGGGGFSGGGGGGGGGGGW